VLAAECASQAGRWQLLKAADTEAPPPQWIETRLRPGRL